MKQNIKALLIEDNEEDRYIFSRFLRKLNEVSESLNVNVKESKCLAQAVEILEEETFDIVFLDLSLPDASDFEGLKILKDRFQNEFPIIVLTGIESEKIALGAIRKGAQDYLQKNEISPYNLGRSIIYAIERSNTAIEIEKLRIQQAKSLKMATLGEMSGSIAHEINNPLTIMLGYADRIKKTKAENIEHSYEAADKIITVIHRVAKIVKSMKAYARIDSDDPMEVSNFKTIIDDTLSLCFEKIKLSGIDLKLGKIVNVNLLCKDVQISQVILNLLNNASDAIKDKDEKWIEISSAQEDDLLYIFIADSGVIEDPYVKRKMFQPFFTTKGKGLGTGLGMNISKNIIDAHAGSISLEDTLNTTFKITLPIKA